MSKKVTTLYLERELVEEAKRRGINLSELFNDFLREYLIDEELKKMEEIEKEINELERKLAQLRAMRETLLKMREKKLKKKSKIDNAIRLVKELIELNERRKTVRTIAEAEDLTRKIKRKTIEIKELLKLQDEHPTTVDFFKAINKGDISAARKIIEKVVK